MIKASLIYAAITVLLALIDAIRIKRAKGIVENINHFWSSLFAALGIVIVAAMDIGKYSIKDYFIFNLFLWPACGCIRWVVFDIALNLFRRFKIDYTSPTTNSQIDRIFNKESFWAKRVLGLAAWMGLVFIHYLIFKV